MLDTMRCLCACLGSRAEGLPEPAARSRFVGGVQPATKLQSSTPGVAVLKQSKSCRDAYVLDVRCNGRPAPQIHSCLSCHSGHLTVRQLCSLRKMGLIEALLGFGCGPGSRSQRKALTSAVLYNRCCRFWRKVGPSALGKPRCCDLGAGPSGAVAVSSALALSETC